MIKWLFGRIFKRIVGRALEEGEDFSEYQKSLMDLKANYERLSVLKERIDKRNASFDKKSNQQKRKKR